MIISKFMNSKLFILPTILLIFITSIQTCHGQFDEQYYNCTSNYTCGQVAQNLTYPFWGGSRPQYCGHPAFELKCQDNDYPTFNIGNHEFRVLGINQSSYRISLARLDLWESYCTQDWSNITLSLSDPFRYNDMVRGLFIFYNCTPEMTRAFPNFTCNVDGRESDGFYADLLLLGQEVEGLEWTANAISCSQRIGVPVMRDNLNDLLSKTLTLQDALKRGFEMQYDAKTADCLRCEGSGGICGSDSTGIEFICHCRDGTRRGTCQNSGDKLSWGMNLVIVFGAAGLTIIAMVLIYFIYRRYRNRRYTMSSWISRNISSHPSSMSDLENAVTIYGVRIFKYSELEKATNYFDSKKELGDGGFGTVYQGKLRDGRVVAVKRLYEHNYKRVEQFMNEVEILTRLRHQNLVSLYGCTSRHSRELLLVYEYIPNGTVADHLHGEQAKPGSLSWNTRMSIAIQTASALSYLHASDVIHRDVKTNNILLDNNFCVKVADFGLSRLFPNDVTHVSTAPQGTAGYVDPEYHESYQLTNKSDVYSFGVVLIELISSKPAVDITRHRHEINLSSMAINKIQNNALHELVDPFLGFESDSMVRNTITEVAELAFQCLQSEQDMRPSMEKVLENLKRIQGENGYSENTEEMEIPADEVVLSKSDPPPLSLDSVNVNWICRETTPIASS